eukprot:TRINITY_DN54604_c0_g1_i1.p1 TRINITY_DN54604_c0_g1~~TRINITY_DN54604_c0_g1_i1.p1  ORF type:complete len:187 (+),score=14.59 TRINITY_DN54604_c0_g1_i1:85-645(+)
MDLKLPKIQKGYVGDEITKFPNIDTSILVTERLLLEPSISSNKHETQKGKELDEEEERRRKLREEEEKRRKKEAEEAARLKKIQQEEEEVALAAIEEHKRTFYKKKEGYLIKKSATAVVGWQKRYCVLRKDSTFSYYGSEHDCNESAKDPKGTFIILDVTTENRDKVFLLGGKKILHTSSYRRSCI